MRKQVYYLPLPPPLLEELEPDEPLEEEPPVDIDEPRDELPRDMLDPLDRAGVAGRACVFLLVLGLLAAGLDAGLVAAGRACCPVGRLLVAGLACCCLPVARVAGLACCPAGRVLVAGLVCCPVARVAGLAVCPAGRVDDVRVFALPTAVPLVAVPRARTASVDVPRVAAPRVDTMRPLLSRTTALPRAEVPETARPFVVPRTLAVRVLVRP